MDDLARQIHRAIDAAFIDPMEMLLGPREELRTLRAASKAHAQAMAANLTGGDDRLAAQTAIDLACALFPGDAPIPDVWWATPLGRAVATTAGHPSAEAVSYSVAAAMLGISKGRIQQLVEAGKLERHPDKGITTTSIQQRLSGQQPSSPPSAPS